jgi:hypothetical protein
LALISFKQDMHPAMWPHGMQAPSTRASKHITHDEEPPSSLFSPVFSGKFSTDREEVSMGLESIDG